MWNRRWIVAVALSASGFPAASHAGVISTPHPMSQIEGNENNLAPFTAWAPTRVQQVFGASEFASWTSPQSIQAIAFRQDRDGSAFGATLSDITIRLSTTSREVDGLSATFADNIGTDVADVFLGTLAISSIDRVSAGSSRPHAFDIVIHLQQPFLFDPSRGNLLLDIINPSPGSTTFVDSGTPSLDAVSTTDDGVSRVLGYLGTDPTNPYESRDLSRGFKDTLGLVTEFRTGGELSSQPDLPIAQIVPEPATAVVIAVGLLGWIGRNRRRAASR